MGWLIFVMECFILKGPTYAAEETEVGWGDLSTVKLQKVWSPEQIIVIILKFDHGVMCPKDVDGMANSVDPNRTAALGPHYLPRPV